MCGDVVISFQFSLTGGSKKDNFLVGCTPNCTEENYSFTTVDGYLQTIRECCADFLCNDEIHDTGK